MASLVERNKRYYVVYSYEDEKGEKKQKWEGFTTRADAVRRKSEVEYRKEVGSVVIPQCETMNELLKEYIAMYGKSNWSLCGKRALETAILLSDCFSTGSIGMRTP